MITRMMTRMKMGRRRRTESGCGIGGYIFGCIFFIFCIMDWPIAPSRCSTAMRNQLPAHGTCNKLRGLNAPCTYSRHTHNRTQHTHAQHTTEHNTNSLYPPNREDSTYLTLFIMAGVALGVYVVGIPVLFGGLLWRYRARVEEQKVRYWLGNLYYCYKRKYYWFEMVILVRRLLLAVLISSYLPTPSSLSLALLVQLWVRPFALKVDNRLESISIATILITFVVQYLLFINGTATSTWEVTDTRDALTGDWSLPIGD